MSEFRSKGPELLLDLIDQLTVALEEMVSLERSKAQHVAKEVAERMTAHWGGQNLYFPMGMVVKLSRRDRQIYDDFNGDNHHELARKYGVSLQWIYKIVKAMRKEHIASLQSDMFDETDPDSDD